MESTLSSEIVTSVLRQLHAQASREDAGAKERVRLRETKLGRRLDPVERYELYGDAPLAITREEVGHLYYLMASSSHVRSVVEFGASHGISTIYLAAALRDTGGGGIISTEILPRKAKTARHNLTAVDLGDDPPAAYPGTFHIGFVQPEPAASTPCTSASWATASTSPHRGASTGPGRSTSGRPAACSSRSSHECDAETETSQHRRRRHERDGRLL